MGCANGSPERVDRTAEAAKLIGKVQWRSRDAEEAYDRFVCRPDHPLQPGWIGRLCGIPHPAQISRRSRHECHPDHGVDWRKLDAFTGRKKEDYCRMRENEEEQYADLFRLHG